MKYKKFENTLGRAGLASILLVSLFLCITEDHPILAAREIVNSTVGCVWFGLCGVFSCYAIVDRILFGIRGDK